MILTKEEENDAEVRREDQDKINEFGRLNARLYEVRDEISSLKVWGMGVRHNDILKIDILNGLCRIRPG